MVLRKPHAHTGSEAGHWLEESVFLVNLDCASTALTIEKFTGA